MNFLGIGVAELATILVIAIIVVGPDKAVEFARSIGRITAKLSAEAKPIVQEFREALDIPAEQDEPAAPVTDVAVVGAGDAPGAVVSSTGAGTASQEPRILPPEPPAKAPAPAGSTMLLDSEINVDLSAEQVEEDDDEPVELEVGDLVVEDHEVEPITLDQVAVIEDGEELIDDPNINGEAILDSQNEG